MTNPDNAVRVRARNGGRASVYEANGWAQIYKQGLLAGTGVTEDTRASMNVLVGGSQSAPDVVIAETASHYKIGMDIVGQVPVTITAPGSNSRLTAIIVYTDDLSVMSEETSITGSPATCGLITVNGDTHASNPQPPSDSQIRQAITADGATGGQAAYAVIALVKVSAGAENISNSMITIQRATDAIVTSENVDFATLTFPAIDEEKIIHEYGTVSQNGWSYTAEQNCYITGKATVSAAGGQACLRLQGYGSRQIAGIPYWAGNFTQQIGFCMPLGKGQTIEASLEKSSKLEAMTVVGVKYVDASN